MSTDLSYPLAPAAESLAVLQAAGDTRVIVEPKDNELFLDIDDVNYDGSDLFSTIETLLASNDIYTKLVRATPSRTPGHQHVVLAFDRDLSPIERIALQAIYGSDPKRELLALLRVWNNVAPVTVFFEEESLGEIN